MAKSSKSVYFLLVLLIALISWIAYSGNIFQALNENQNTTQIQNGTAIQQIQPNSIQAYFCPQNKCSEKLIAQFSTAKKSIHGAIYSFTLDSIGDSLVAAKNRGIEVKIIMEKQQLSRYSELKKLQEAGIEVRIDSNPNFMHDKFSIIDGKIVTTGSFNWTQNADKENNENLVIINSPELATQFDSEFGQIFEKGTQATN